MTLRNNGNPVWNGPSTEDLKEVLLPNGQLIYWHPTDNSSAINWNPQGVNINFYPPIMEVSLNNGGLFTQFTGEENTQIIVNNYGTSAEYAARKCDELVAFGFDDWYLPSSGELYEIYKTYGPPGTGDIPDGLYYSSTTGVMGDIVAILNFQNGEFLMAPPNTQMRCRCARK